MPGENTLEEYLVKIGWDIDEIGFNAANKKLNEFASGIVKKSGTAVQSVVKAGGIVLDIILSVNDATWNLLSTTAKLDLKTETLARRMWTTEQNSRSLSSSLDALGMSYEELFYATPEQFNRFLELNQLGKTLEAPEQLDVTLKKIRDIQFEFSKLKQIAFYGTRWVSYYLGEYLGVDIDEIIGKLKNFNKWLIDNLSEITRKIAYVLSVFYRLGKAGYQAIKIVGEGVVNLFENVDTSTWKMVATITAAVLALKSGPVGLLISTISIILLLLEDFFVWQKGGKSLFDWSDAVDTVEDLKQSFSEIKEDLTPVYDMLKDLWNLIFKDLTPVEALDEILKSIVAAFQLIAAALNDIAYFYDLITGKEAERSKEEGEPAVRRFLNHKSAIVDWFYDMFGNGRDENKDTVFAKIYDFLTGYTHTANDNNGTTNTALRSNIPAYILKEGTTQTNTQNNNFDITVNGLETQSSKRIANDIANRVIGVLQTKPIT